MFENRGIIALFLLGGFFAASSLKQSGSVGMRIGGGVAIVLLLGVNAVLYRNAAIDPDPEFPTSAAERYRKPVVASICFATGLAMLLLG